jgi:hypothetical protein
MAIDKWRWLVLGVSMIVILTASWVPDSRMAILWRIPEPIGLWADENSTLRTGVAFFGGTLLAVCLFGGDARLPRGAMLIQGAAFACLLSAEVGQHWIPNRTFSLFDLFWGCLGIGLGYPLGLGMVWLSDSCWSLVKRQGRCHGGHPFLRCQD